jgi:hypothetical protein
MRAELEFDEKKFWIALFSAVIRREQESGETSYGCSEDVPEGREAVIGNR